MGYKSTKQIKVPKYEKEKRLLKAVEQSPVDNRIVFSFSFFQKHSIRLGDFNNFYPNTNSSLKAVSDFLETLTLISKYEKSHFFSPETKTQFHYNEFTDNDIIDKIENILIRGYNMPQQKVDQFERLLKKYTK